MTFDEFCITQPETTFSEKTVSRVRSLQLGISQPIRGIRGIKKTNGVEKFSDREVGKKSSEIKQKIHERFKL